MANSVIEFVSHGDQLLGVHRYPRSQGPAVVVFPAMGVPARCYRRFASELVAAGCDVSVVDLRGTGDSRPVTSRRSHCGYAELVADAGVVLDHLSEHLEGRTTLLVGHSLGGHVASLKLALRQRESVSATPRVHGLALVACGLPYHALYGWRAPYVRAFGAALRAAARILGYWPGYGFGGRQPEWVIRDWAHTVRTGNFASVSGVDLNPGLGEIDMPVMSVTVDNDQFTPPVTTRHLVDKFSAAEVVAHHYTDAEAGTRLDHFKWAQASGPLVKRIRSFVDRL